MGALQHILIKNQAIFYPVVPFSPCNTTLAALDLTKNNKGITEEIFSDTETFSRYLEELRKSNNADYLIGGYDELRVMYERSALFDLSTERTDAIDSVSEPRRLHIGTDIWAGVGTPVHAPLEGMVHSFANNNTFGDYGATIILFHQLDGFSFYTLYGHLSKKNIEHLQAGDHIASAEVFAQFGPPDENGHWPPHVHFQVIADLESFEGDYPGVCRYSERKKYLDNCPDPDYILQMKRWIV